MRDPDKLVRRRDGEVEQMASPADGMVCECGFYSPMNTSMTNRNPGRRFMGCGNDSNTSKFKFFQWIDPETCQFGKRLLSGLYEKIMSAERKQKNNEEEVLWLNSKLGQCKVKLEDKDEIIAELVGELHGLKKKNKMMEKMLIIVVVCVILYWFGMY